MPVSCRITHFSFITESCTALNAFTKTTAASALVITVALAAAGCGDDAAGNASDSSDASVPWGSWAEKCSDRPDPNADFKEFAEPSQDVIDAAVEEGAVNFYTGFQPQAYNLVKALFQKKYPGVTVNAFEGSSSDLMSKFLADAEAENQQADAIYFTVDSGFYEEGFSKGYLRSLDDAMPGFLDSWPDTNIVPVGDDFAAVHTEKANGFAYNTDLVPEDMVPTSWEDLTDPAFKGHIATVDPNRSVSYANHFKLLLDELGEDGMQALGDNIIKTPLYESITPQGQAVAAGAGWVALDMGDTSVTPLVEEGAPMKYVLPDVATGPRFALALASDEQAPHPNAAALFANWLYSPEGQWVVGCTQVGGVPAYPDLQPAKEYRTFTDDESVGSLEEVSDLLGIEYTGLVDD